MQPEPFVFRIAMDDKGVYIPGDPRYHEIQAEFAAARAQHEAERRERRERRSIAYQRLLVLVVCWLAAYGLARLLLDLLTN
jgi:hypothetical protein